MDLHPTPEQQAFRDTVREPVRSPLTGEPERALA